MFTWWEQQKKKLTAKKKTFKKGDRGALGDKAPRKPVPKTTGKSTKKPVDSNGKEVAYDEFVSSTDLS